MSSEIKSKRIFKNTLMLYFRQILIMLVSLYTVRIVLDVLGAEDYGIYNVVAGVVVLFSFVNNAMASGTQRFLNFYLGKKDLENTNKVYSASIIIHFFISILFIIIAETVGLWFVSTQLNIPTERFSVTLVVYQFTIITTVFNILRVPYNATVIAYERMNFFAISSIVEACLKLLLVVLLKIAPFDKLIFYAFFLSVITCIITLIYKFFCNRVFEIAHYKKNSDFGFIKEQLSFSGWSLFGAVANVSNSQGTNIVLNLFTNVTVNAAMGIANQVNSAVYSFVSNFQTAFNPQIIKSYAENDKNYFINLICTTAKISFLLLSFIVIPLFVNTEFVLNVWLKEVPDYSISFVRLILIWSLVETWNGPLWMSIQATGNIRKYQIFISLFIFLNLPFTIISFKLGASPEWILYIRIGINIFNTFWRVFFLHSRIDLSRRRFVFDVIIRCSIIGIIGLTTTFLVGKMFSNQIMYFFITCVFSVFINTVLLFIIGLSHNERDYIKSIFNRRVHSNYE